MVTVKEIAQYFESLVPTSMKMDFDNVGLLAGDGNIEVAKVLVTLDITDEVIDEAVEYGAHLILAHHPLMFSLKNASTDDPIGRKIVRIIGSGMAAISLHTNLDAVEGGVNDALMAVLGVSSQGIIEPFGTDKDGKAYGMGRYGTVEECSLDSFLRHCKEALQCNGLRYIDGGKSVQKVAVCGGSGSSMLNDVAALGCDTFVTADVKHNGFLDAREMGINLIDAGHYSTENVVTPVLAQMVKDRYPDVDVKISVCHTQPEQYFV